MYGTTHPTDILHLSCKYLQTTYTESVDLNNLCAGMVLLHAEQKQMTTIIKMKAQRADIRWNFKMHILMVAICFVIKPLAFWLWSSMQIGGQEKFWLLADLLLGIFKVAI